MPDETTPKPLAELSDDSHDADDEEELEVAEAYCVKCKMKVEMQDPEPVWTSRGQPGTRGVCPICGTTVFRMGRTPAHAKMSAPPPVRVGDVPKVVVNRGRKKALPATYINAGEPDAEFGARLAKELDNAGVHTWYDPKNATDDVNWAGGVHPALRDCVKMVVVLSNASKDLESVKKAWTFFKTTRKPIVIALLDATEAPDPLRRSARFDFSKDYKAAFRQMIQMLSDR